MQQTKIDSDSGSASEVFVHLDGGEDGIKQPGSFRCCPLGVQFYAPKEMPLYRTMKFRLEPSTEAGEPIDCLGVVVHCQFDKVKSLYRTWVSFIDLPEEKRQHLRCISKCSEFLCPHCENY